MEKRIEEAYAKRPKDWIYHLTILVVVLGLMFWSMSSMETAGTTQNGGKMALNILNGIVHPEKKLLFNLTTQGVPYLLLETICIAFMGTVVGAIFSVPLAFLSASNLTPKPIAFLGRILIMVIRTVPAFVYGLMFVRVTGPGPFAGLMTMSLTSIGMVSKMYIEAIEDLDTKILESLDAMGCTRIVIGHRLSTIRHCSRILVMDQGKIIEDGTYEELIAKNGAFAELVERQRLDRND